MDHSEIIDPIFREAVEAIGAGNVATLQRLLESYPALIGQRLDVPEQSFLAILSTLAHYR